MASNKIRSKNDTWTSEELRMALKEEDAAGRMHHREKSSSKKKIRDIDEENKGNKKSQDIVSRRRQLREEEEEEARQLKEARKTKRADQNARSHTVTDEEEQRRKKREQRAKEGNALDENEEERRRRRHERKLKEGNLVEDKDEEDRRQRRPERKPKEANQTEEEEERRQKRHERKGKDDKLLADHDEEGRRQRRREHKTKGGSVIDDDEEEHRRRKREQKTKEGSAPDKDEEEHRRRRHERKGEGKGTERNDEEHRRQRHERKLKEENPEDEDENERRRRRHEKRSKDGNVADNDEEERRRRRHERKLKEGKIAEEDEGGRRQRRHERKLKEANMPEDNEEERRRRRREQKTKEKNPEYKDSEERHHKREQRHSKKESDKTVYQDNNMNASRQIKSAGDKNMDNLKKTKKSKHEEEVNYQNDKQQEQMAKEDIKHTRLQSAQHTNKLETEVNSKSRDQESAIQDEYNYDDDFENYSDDFDNDSIPENNSNQENAFHEDIKENMEHSYLSSADSRSRDSARVSSAEKSSSSVNERPAYQVMDFSHAKIQKMTQKTRSKLQSRSDDLCSLIALDVAVGKEVFELAPISEYELYIRNFGKANSNQVYVQTGDDNVDRDVQTEEIEYLDKWTQHPPNGAAAFGGNYGQNFNQTDFAARSQLHDSARLNKFLLQATQMISILLEENLSSDTHNLTHQKSSQLSFSKSFFTLSSCPLFQEHTIDCCCFANSAHTNNLLTVHNSPVVTIKEKNEKKKTSLGSYVALWDLRTPSRPYKILYSESAISCCFGSLKLQLVLAGCVDGAVVVWDLRESESLHKQVNFEDLEYCVRYPAYNTAGVLSFNSHCSTIQTIQDIPLQVGRETETSVQKESFNSGFSCQLLSMDQSGLVNLWVIVELSSVDPSGSPIDLGLSPGSRIKLEHTSSINVHAAVRDSLFPTSISTQQLCLLPKDPNQIYITTDTGHVIHSVRLGSQPYPRVHCSRKVTLSSVLSRVLSLDFSPFMAPCFLTGHSDGSVNLYHTSLECPVVTWLPSQTGAESIVSVRWSQSRPTVFYVLNDSSTLFVFDLLEQDNNAVCTQTYEDRLTSINVICNSNATDHTEKMVLCFANGRIEVHTISEAFSECQILEMEFLENYLHRM